jgi:uncharacterized membrane protein
MAGLIGWTSLIWLGLGALSGLLALFAVAMLKNKDIVPGIATFALAAVVMVPGVYFGVSPWIAPLGAVVAILLMFTFLFAGGKLSSRKKAKKAEAESKFASDQIAAYTKAAAKVRERQVKELQKYMDEIAQSASSSSASAAQPVPVADKIDYTRRR